MKNFYNTLKFILLTVASVLLLSLPGCSDSNDVENPPAPEDKLELIISVGTVTSNSIEATVTPSNNEAAYYAGVHSAVEVGEDKGAGFVQELIAQEGFDALLKQNKQQLVKNELTPESDYYVVAFGYDAQKGAVTTDVVLSDMISTLEEPGPVLGEINLKLEGEPTWRNAVVQVDPSNDEVKYICDVCTKEKFDAQYANNLSAIIEDHIRIWKGDAILYGEDEDAWPQFMANYQMYGNQMISVNDDVALLRWNTEYVFYCFGMNDIGEQTTEIVTLPFNTSAPTPSENDITVKITQTDKTTVNFTIETTNDDPYFVSIQTIDYLARFGEGKDESYEELVHDLISLKTDEEIAACVFYGTQDLTNSDISKTVNGFKEYQVVVWGFDNGPTTEVIFSETFKPGTTHLPAEPGFELTVSEITWCSANVLVSPKDETMEWICGGMTKEKFDADYAGNLQKIVEDRISGWQNEADLYGGTWQESMAHAQLSGVQTVTANDIIGFTRLSYAMDFVVYVFGMNDEGVTTSEVYTTEFSTLSPTPSDNTFTITIDAMTRSSVTFTVTTTNNDPYYVTIEKKNSVDTWGDEVISKTIPDSDNQLEMRIFTGTQTLTQADLGKSVNGFADYYVVVYGFNDGPTTAVSLSEAFRPADSE